MAEQTEVEWPLCEQAGCAGIRLASARLCLAHASEEETAAALKLISETGAIDARGVPITGALLERILTAAPRGENEEPLLKDCQFGGATFTGAATFAEASFNGEHTFGSFAQSRVLSNDFSHIWPSGWRLARLDSGEYTVVPTNTGGES